MFNNLNPQEFEIVLLAMNHVSKKVDEVVIKQGDDGDNLYVVESGVLSCSRVIVSQLQLTYLVRIRYLFERIPAWRGVR
jgi:cAMP-dependent protein kinase regulator